MAKSNGKTTLCHLVFTIVCKRQLRYNIEMKVYFSKMSLGGNLLGSLFSDLIEI